MRYFHQLHSIINEAKGDRTRKLLLVFAVERDACAVNLIRVNLVDAESCLTIEEFVMRHFGCSNYVNGIQPRALNVLMHLLLLCNTYEIVSDHKIMYTMFNNASLTLYYTCSIA